MPDPLSEGERLGDGLWQVSLMQAEKEFGAALDERDRRLAEERDLEAVLFAMELFSKITERADELYERLRSSN